MKLHELENTPGAIHRTKRLGSGVGTGNGKTCGKGHKGQKSRSGKGIRPMFEGGQMPLYRKLPQRGFNHANFHKTFAVVNVGDLEAVTGDIVDRESLVAAGLIRRNAKLIKILATGDVSRAFKVTVERCSASAKSKIEQAGGSVTETGLAPAQEKAAEAPSTPDETPSDASA
ncbi:MAG: 50S ribosomal protein L15 [Opitutales bacterium]